ncbi:RICIN domain-containing protein [Streptomyces mauvecolor]|uniref:RICIN domain-containing protein n=1 Tax=Streptomyces mauvecolor TaxID=58345 RepID=A0ABV9UKX0_9ACTN
MSPAALGPKHCRLRARWSGKYLDVQGGSKESGAAVLQSTPDPARQSQLWAIGYTRFGDNGTRMVVNTNAIASLAIEGDSMERGAEAIQGMSRKLSDAWVLTPVK